MTSAQDPAAPGGARTLPPGEPWEGERKPAYGSLRLQPVMLGPPPEDDGALAKDDIDPRELGGKSRTGLIMGLLAALLLAGGVGGALFYFQGLEKPEIAATPAPPAAAPLPAAPPPVAQLPAETPAVPAQPPAGPPNVDMARIDSELVPPTTDGLSPARRVQALRILVENDREIIQPR